MRHFLLRPMISLHPIMPRGPRCAAVDRWVWNLRRVEHEQYATQFARIPT